MPEIVPLSPEVDDVVREVDAMTRNMSSSEQFQKNRARLYWVFYTSLLEEGFDEQDALRLTEAEFAG